MVTKLTLKDDIYLSSRDIGITQLLEKSVFVSVPVFSTYITEEHEQKISLLKSAQSVFFSAQNVLDPFL